jgi:hypothetical protein
LCSAPEQLNLLLLARSVKKPDKNLKALKEICLEGFFVSGRGYEY